MMNDPTKSAMSANTSRNVLKMPMIFWNASWLSAVNSLPVMASVPEGITDATRVVSSLWEMPLAPAMEIQS